MTDNLTAAVEGAIDYSLADEGMVDPELVAQFLRREWSAGLSAHDFDGPGRLLIPLSDAKEGQLVRIFAGETTLLGRIDRVLLDVVHMKTARPLHSIVLYATHRILCEVLEG